jgi:hypothetical protein
MDLGTRLIAQERQREALFAFRYAIGPRTSACRESAEIPSHLMARGHPESAQFFLVRVWREHPKWYTALGLLAAVDLNAGRP